MSACATETASQWVRICAVEDIPVLGSRVVRHAAGDIAVFKNDRDEVFALRDSCPHKGGPLSQGIVHEHTVTCPLHSWKIDLGSGAAQAPDSGCTHRYEVSIREQSVYLLLPLNT